MNWRWAPFSAFFSIQQFFWELLLRLIVPDCREMVDAKINAKAGETLDDSDILDEIYKFLGILDSKASALMRYNGIILALIALMLRSGHELPDAGYYIVYMTIGSIMACLLVVGIFWRFLENVVPAAPAANTPTAANPPPDAANAAPLAVPATTNRSLAEELGLIRRVLIIREAAYQIAWWLSAAVSMVLLVKFREFVTVREFIAPG